MWYDQSAYRLRCEWGEQGAAMLAPHADAVIIVDVLSFSTCVDMATGRGAVVYPYRWKDESPAAFARDVGAILAGPRSRARPSLSPGSLVALAPGTSLVLPSPNGATISHATGRTPTFAACFRNARAVAYAAQLLGSRVAVIPAGERWPDGSLRPCLEDWLGAGAVLQYLRGDLSPEACAARAAYEQHASNLTNVVCQCASGRELIEQDWEADVLLAAQIDVSDTAPRLVDAAYRDSNAPLS